MSKVFEIDYRTGSTIERFSGALGTNVGNKITKQEKGLAYQARQANSGEITYPAADMTALNFGTGAFSVVMAFRMGEFINIGSTNNAIAGKGSVSGSTGISFYYGSNQQLIIAYGDGVGGTSILTLNDFGSLYDGKYHLAILTFDQTTYKAFLDNVKEATESTTIRDITSVNNFYIGREESTGRRSNSDIAYIRAYDHELTSQERADLQIEFERSYGITENKRNFNYPKPTDLSNEVDNVVGAQLVTNGGFDDDTGWTEIGESTISGGVARILSTAGDYSAIAQTDTNILTIGKKYRVSFQVIATDGTVLSNNGGGISWDTATTGNKSQVITATEARIEFKRPGASITDVTIDNVSFQELTGLVAAYNMIPSSGGVLTDVSGSGNNGTITGALATKEGMILDGVDDVIVSSGNAFIDAQGSMFARIKILSGTPTDFVFRGVGSGTNRWYVEYTGTDLSFLRGTNLVNVTKAIDEDKWYDFVWTWNATGTLITLYVDGILVDSGTYTAVGSPGDAPVYIGNDGTTSFANFEVSDARFTNTVATAEEAKDYHNSFIKPTLINTFKDDGADGIVKLPNDMIDGTGDYKVEELDTQDPVLKDLDVGTKILECDSSGTIATQSKQAYGEWEFDLYKGADGNIWQSNFISDAITPTTGYFLRMSADELLTLRVTGGATLFNTANSYIDINTYYELKIARLASEGVFLDIPTGQSGDCANSGIIPYDSFTGNGRYGFSAIKTSTGSQLACGTADDVDIVNTEKYLVEFDLALTSGSLPNVRLAVASGSSTQSNAEDTVEGRNSCILTATGTTTGVIDFRNDSGELSNYKVSGLTIRRIYDADTFAVFIKGGDFGDDAWTLVDPSGGSGSNPVTDSTHTTSEFTVLDVDAGDRISRIKYTNLVKQ